MTKELEPSKSGNTHFEALKTILSDGESRGDVYFSVIGEGKIGILKRVVRALSASTGDKYSLSPKDLRKVERIRIFFSGSA